MTYCNEMQLHYEHQWSNTARRCTWQEGPIDQLPQGFCVLEFRPVQSRNMWTYATCCMSQPNDDNPIEVHLFSEAQADSHVELLTAIAHYNRTGNRLGLGHTVNFGRPWLPDSACDFGLLSLPYIDGPDLEVFNPSGTSNIVRCLWVVPITSAELSYAKRFGVDALEIEFEASHFNYLDPRRQSVV